MACCGAPRPVTCAHERDEVSLCAACARILHVGPRTRRDPRAEDYSQHLKREISLSARAAAEEPWVEAKPCGYEKLGAVSALLTMDLAPEPAVSWREGDALEFRGIDFRGPKGAGAAATLVSLVDGRLVARVRPSEGFRALLSQRWLPLEVRRADLTHLLRNQLKVYERIADDTPIVERLLDPRALPPLEPVAPGDFRLLEALDPASAANAEQAEAFARVLALEEDGVALVQGPPGTGKTRLVANLVRALVARGRSVLVTAHTNVAVDHALEKILDLQPDLAASMGRFGPPLKVAPRIQPLWRDWRSFPDEEDARDDPHAGAFSAVFGRLPIVGVTLASLVARMAHRYSPAYDRFDCVVVDEASMNLLPPVASACHVGKRLVLVGDHRQLPPIVRAEEYAARPGFAMSPFERVATARPELLCLLRRQYRSLPGLMGWSNETLYGGALVDVRHGAAPTVRVGAASFEGPLAWIDTTRVPGNGHVVRLAGAERQPSFANPTHAAVALALLEALVAHGHDAREIGYISPYRLQASIVGGVARARPHLAGLEASTVDAFQGREKTIVLFDTTTTTPQRSHDSVQRLNVGLTRAKDLLLVLGVRPLATDPLRNPFMHSLERWFDGKPTVDATLVPLDAETMRDAASLLPVPRD